MEVRFIKKLLKSFFKKDEAYVQIFKMNSFVKLDKYINIHFKNN